MTHSPLPLHGGVPEHEHGDDGALDVRPTAGLDYWSRTYYEPVLIKHDAQPLLASQPCDFKSQPQLLGRTIAMLAPGSLERSSRSTGITTIAASCKG